MVRQKLYPLAKTRKTYMLPVDAIHTIYVEESGNPNGIPVICLHGGPGAPMRAGYRRFMNPKLFRIISFHQRGCGKSKPYASLVRNETKYLIQDMEKIRKKLNINKWIVTGGSWGGTLALLYGIKHPTKCLAIIPCSLSIFQCYTEQSTKVMAPDHHKLWKLYPNKSDHYNMKMYLKFLKSPNKKTRTKYMKRWNSVESEMFNLMKFPKIVNKKKKTKSRGIGLPPCDQYTIALIECHYYYNRGFMPTFRKKPKQQIARLKNVPGYIIHGRFDLICSPINALMVHESWPGSKLYITDVSGHSSYDKGNALAMLNVFEKLSRKFGIFLFKNK